MEELKNLRDIKPIVQIPDNSLYIFIAIIITLLIAAAIVATLLKRKMRKPKRFIKTPLELAKERIKNINYSDAKSVTYTFLEDVSQFVNEKNKAEFEAIAKELQAFKYKKDIPPMSNELIERIKKFIKGIK